MMTILFSIENVNVVISKFLKSFKRFPFTLLCSFVASCCIIVGLTQPDYNKTIAKVGILCILFLPLFFSTEVFEERRLTPKFLIRGIVVIALLVLFFYGSPQADYILNDTTFLIKFIVLGLAFHLLASVSPYLFDSKTTSFWHYNKTLFINILTAFIYSGTLSVGLSLALLGIQNLFELKINEDWYFYIFGGINIFFNTLIFVSKLPDFKKIDIDLDYPLGLKYFTQFVLLPLVAIYLSILIAYESKIIFEWTLPKGWVSSMVLASAIFGILAFLLIHPLKKDNKWIHSFGNLYYWILLPLIVLMLVAIYVRIKQYGITEPRYFVALLALWLLGISLYFSISKFDNIKLIPFSLLIVGLVGIYGPFNAFQSSRINQTNRMVSVLVNKNLLKNGKISLPRNLELKKVELERFQAALEYLSERQPDALKGYLTEKQFKQLKQENSEYQRSELIFKLLNFESKYGSHKNFYFSCKDCEVYNLDKADYLIDTDSKKMGKDILKIDNDAIAWSLDSSKLVLIINETEKVSFDLNSLIYLNGNTIPKQKLTFENDNEKWHFKLLVENGSSRNGKLENVKWKLFLKRSNAKSTF